ncbi:hypothetical protein M8C21_006160 [Ambrosia artemisiifolia]|uniref:Uncharacterized protein n=1 Tax=Ambrosia artemisiifolia TaxID=4212 RepID=A0AAD5C5F9_AMBAR|nr:hypothetical protein M8C21_006160 [Ambrosia artemisiifolia]
MVEYVAGIRIRAQGFNTPPVFFCHKSVHIQKIGRERYRERRGRDERAFPRAPLSHTQPRAAPRTFFISDEITRIIWQMIKDKMMKPLWKSCCSQWPLFNKSKNPLES